MKTILLLSISAMLTLQSFAQSSDFYNQLTGKYADKDGFSATLLTSDMFDLYIRKKNVDEKSMVYETLKKLNHIMVASQSSLYSVNNLTTSPSNPKEEKNEFFLEILDHYKKDGFTLFKTDKRMGEDLKVYLKKSQSKINALALVTNNSFSTSLIELQGDIDLNTLGNLSDALNLKGLENLQKIDGTVSFRTYPGVNISPEKIDEMVAKQMTEFSKQKGFSEKQIGEFEKQAQITAEKQLKMAEKYREMAEKYGREPVFLSSPGDTNVVYYIDGKKVSAEEIKKLDVEKIASVEVNKSDKKNVKSTIRIKTK